MKEFSATEKSPQRILIENAKMRFQERMLGNVAFSLLFNDYVSRGQYPNLSEDVARVHVEPYYLNPSGVGAFRRRDFGICLWSFPEHARKAGTTLQYVSVGSELINQETFKVSDELVGELARVVPEQYDPQGLASGVLLECAMGMNELKATPGLDAVHNDRTHLFETRESARFAEIAARY
jgi:hypothetical protein